MQRTDQLEVLLERLASVPLTWETVFRSPQFTVKLDKEVVDLLIILKDRGIFVSMKCQQEPQKRTGDRLANWVNKSALAALKQVRGGIRTSKLREIWCHHHRRGRVSFDPGQICPIHGVVVIETHEPVTLSKHIPTEIDSVPVTYVSLNDFLILLDELRTFNDIGRYLDVRSRFSPELQRTIGVENDIFKYVVLLGGSIHEEITLTEIRRLIRQHRKEIEELIDKRTKANELAKPIERVSNDLSTRSENYREGLDKEIIDLFDPLSERRNYLLIQEELCDLILDERRKLGTSIIGAMQKVACDDSGNHLIYQASHLDSKPGFLYVFSSSKVLSRNNTISKCITLLQGGLAYYKKSRGLLVNYNLDLDFFDTIFVPSFKATQESQRLGKEYFSKLKTFQVPISKI